MLFLRLPSSVDFAISVCAIKVFRDIRKKVRANAIFFILVRLVVDCLVQRELR